ncbi:MAG TPA: Crp/Fnr family transcriptional regulator [Blastocatellia bacterium]|nr:Crp/Fnr family transcriptional regulator [Blastocatellia bacterium]
MKAPYGLDICENCQACTVREQRLICNLPDRALAEFNAAKFATVYPKGAVLFVEGQQPMGVFVVCSGRVKLYGTSADGKTYVLQIAEPGDVLGLSAVVSGRACEANAETLEPSHITMLKRADFLRLLATHAEMSFRTSQLLALTCHRAHRQASAIGLAQSAREKLARFLLDSCERAGETTDAGIRVRLLLTHAEIGEIIGTSRETVTRLLGQLRKEGVIAVRRSTIVVRDRDALTGNVHS